jgi:hypothetical protein
MKFVHRVAFHATRSQRKKLEGLGIRFKVLESLPGEKNPFIWFDVGEDHPKWSVIRELLESWDESTFLTTRFSKREIESARWIQILSDWHHGFPQPDDDNFGYLDATYDLSGYCERCGTGLVQKAPFQMKGEPRWGKRSILQMNWVFDEYFVRPEVWKAVLKPHGVDSRAVLNRRGAELQTVVQLVVPEEVSIDAEGLPVETCDACGRVKYLPVTRGPLPPMTSEPKSEMVKTSEYFGSGGQAFKAVLVSQALRQSLVEAKVRGASFEPVASSADEVFAKI